MILGDITIPGELVTIGVAVASLGTTAISFLAHQLMRMNRKLTDLQIRIGYLEGTLSIKYKKDLED